MKNTGTFGLGIFAGVLITILLRGILDYGVEDQVIMRENKLHQQLEADVAEAKKITSDPCSRELFRIVRVKGLNDQRFILGGQDMTLTAWDPILYRFVPNGDRVDFYLDLTDIEQHHKLVEFHDPQSKFCRDRLATSK